MSEESDRASEQMRNLWADPKLAQKRADAIRRGIAKKKLQQIKMLGDSVTLHQDSPAPMRRP
jgi:hypothetical protein